MIRAFTVFFFGFSVISFGQQIKEQPESQKFSVGIKLGPSITYASYPEKEQRDLFSSLPKAGFGGQAFIIFPIKHTGFSFLAEGGYSVRGRKFRIEEEGFINNSTYQFAEASMAVRKSIDVNVFKNVPTKVFFNVGPNIQYWVKGKGKFVETPFKIVFGEPSEGDLFTNFMENPNRWLFGIDAGVGFEAPVSPTQHVRVELRGTFGQTYLGKKNSASNYASLSWDDTMITNLKTFSITAAYSFDFDMRARKMGQNSSAKPQSANGRYQAPIKPKTGAKSTIKKTSSPGKAKSRSQLKSKTKKSGKTQKSYRPKFQRR